MGKFSNSLNLVKASWSVLRTYKELIIFPIASAIAAALVALLFAVPLWVSGYFERLDDGGASQIVGFAVLFLFYLVLYTVVNYCNAALVGAALIRLRGGDPTASDGFRIAPLPHTPDHRVCPGRRHGWGTCAGHSRQN